MSELILKLQAAQDLETTAIVTLTQATTNLQVAYKDLAQQLRDFQASSVLTISDGQILQAILDQTALNTAQIGLVSDATQALAVPALSQVPA